MTAKKNVFEKFPRWQVVTAHSKSIWAIFLSKNAIGFGQKCIFPVCYWDEFTYYSYYILQWWHYELIHIWLASKNLCNFTKFCSFFPKNGISFLLCCQISWYLKSNLQILRHIKLKTKDLFGMTLNWFLKIRFIYAFI